MKAETLPFVSIIIPAFNESENLAVSLPALNRILYPPEKFEIIVVDNGSGDGTVGAAEALGAVVIRFPEGKTISAVRNQGAVHASGRVLAFLDADCVVTPGWLLHAVTRLDKTFGVVGSKAFTQPETASWVQRCWQNLVPKTVDRPMVVDWLATQNMVMTRELFDRVGGFDEQLATCEDVDFCYRSGRYTKILYDPAIQVFHLRDPESLAALFKNEFWHGKSALKGVFRHGLLARELFSAGVPFLYFINLGLLFFSLLTGSWFIFTMAAIFFAAVPLAMTVEKVARIDSPKMFLQAFAVNLTYISARALSVISSAIDLMRRR